LNVKAKDKATGKEQHITITGSSNLNEAEIQKMKKEAEQFAEEDKKKKDAIEIRNRADSLVIQSERTLKDTGDKVGDNVKKPVQEKIDALKKILEDKSAKTEDIEKGYKELSDEIQKVGAEMYNSAGKASAKTASEAGESSSTSSETPQEDDDVKVYNKDDKEKGKKNGKKDDSVEGEIVDEEK
jgi:molecular chaperone DnaK